MIDCARGSRERSDDREPVSADSCIGSDKRTEETMRLLALIIFSLLLVLPSAAAAKSGIVLDSTPEGYTVGEPWIVTVTAIRHDAKVALPRTAAIRIEKQHGDQTRTFAAQRQRDGIHVAHVVFPSSGVWTYSVIGIGRLPGARDGIR
jgi:hypothetical protein